MFSRRRLALSLLTVLLSACHSPSGPSGPALSLPANVVDPATVNAVSKFNACVGHAFHLYCDNSETGLRYFHINFMAGLLGQHVTAGDFMGDAVLLGTDQTPSQTWQNSSNFDIAVFEGDDSVTVDYFAVLSTSSFAAWATRGLTSITQTIVTPAPICSTYDSNIGNSGILVFTPSL